VHRDDHPATDLQAQRYRTSLPPALENFARSRAPAAQRLEFCIADDQVVLRRGWVPIGPQCRAEHGDERYPLAPSHLPASS
jgi:hypothetical protein